MLDSHDDRKATDRFGATTESLQGDLLSDKLGLPLLTEDAAPLSHALHVQTLIDEPKPARANAPTAKVDQDSHSDPLWVGVETPAQATAPMFAALAFLPQTADFDKFGRARSPRGAAAANENRATTPAGRPRWDAATWVGVPSNHPKTRHSVLLASLDKFAIGVGGVMVIGPLFAAMIGRLVV